MSASVGYATLQILPSMKGFGKALSSGTRGPGRQAGTTTAREFSGAMGGAMGSLAGRVFAPLAAAAATAGIGAALVSSVRAAGELEQSVGAVTTVFKGNAAEMLQWSEGAATAVGLTKNQYNEFAAVIGTQLKNAGVPMKELGAQTNSLITAGADLASMFGGTTSEAVDALSSALKGEMDPIERYGISLNAATLEAKAAELGFQKVGATLSQEAKAAAVMALVQEQGADAMGNFAKEATTFGGVMQRNSALWGNISTTIGQAFLPAATAAGQVLQGILPTVQNMATAFRDWSVSLFESFQQAGGGAAGLAAIFQQLQAQVLAWVQGGGIETLLQGFMNARTAFFDAILQAAPGIIEALLAFVPQLLAFITGSFIPQIITIITTTFPQIITTITTLLPQIVQAIVTLVPQVLTAGIQVFMSLVDALLQMLPTLITTIVGLLPSITSALLSLLPKLLKAGINLFMALVDAVLKVLPDLLSVLLGDLLPGVLETVLEMIPALLEAAVELFLALLDAVLKVLPQLVTLLIGTVLPKLVMTIIRMLPQILSAAVEVFMALVTGIGRVLPKLLNFITGSVIPKTVSFVAKAVPKLLAKGKDWIGGLWDGLKDKWSSVSDWFSDLPGKVKDMLSGAGEWLLSAGKDVVSGFISGITSMGDSIVSAVKSTVTDRLPSFVKDALGIHSPSRVFMELGGYTAEGMAVGIAKGARDVQRAADALVPSAPKVGAFGSPNVAVAAGSQRGGSSSGMPTTLVVVDADGDLIGRMRVEAGRVAEGSITPLTLGRAAW